MASCTAANTARNSLPQTALRSWSPTAGWPQLRSFCCWRSPFVRPFAAPFQISPPLSFFVARGRRAVVPLSLAAAAGPCTLAECRFHPSQYLFFFHSSTESDRVCPFADWLARSCLGHAADGAKNAVPICLTPPPMPLCRLNKLSNNHRDAPCEVPASGPASFDGQPRNVAQVDGQRRAVEASPPAHHDCARMVGTPGLFRRIGDGRH